MARCASTAWAIMGAAWSCAISRATSARFCERSAIKSDRAPARVSRSISRNCSRSPCSAARSSSSAARRFANSARACADAARSSSSFSTACDTTDAPEPRISRARAQTSSEMPTRRAISIADDAPTSPMRSWYVGASRSTSNPTLAGAKRGSASASALSSSRWVVISTCAPAPTSFSSAATAMAAPSRGSVSAAISSISTSVPGPAASRM